jgi:hypothetical protein
MEHAAPFAIVMNEATMNALKIMVDSCLKSKGFVRDSCVVFGVASEELMSSNLVHAARGRSNKWLFVNFYHDGSVVNALYFI